MHDFIQSGLTVAVQVIFVAGFGGIVLHALLRATIAQLINQLIDIDEEKIEPQAQAQPQPKKLPEPEEKSVATATFIESDIWEEPISTSSPRYWMCQPQPQQPILLLLPPAKEQPKKRGRKPGSKNKPKASKPAASKSAASKPTKTTRQRSA
ncbi:MAG TPA: hypothetical protein DCE56_05555 [Cyanobacteria bacterium UBA8553]|nr:hypothetical protein [Cyanobacteria bacterium UBA8553]